MESFFDASIAADRERLRIPPHSIEAESSLLGALMLDNESWNQVSEMITESDFYRHEHRLIFRSLAALISAEKPADVITVFEETKLQGKDQEFGGLGFVHAQTKFQNLAFSSNSSLE